MHWFLLYFSIFMKIHGKCVENLNKKLLVSMHFAGYLQN